MASPTVFNSDKPIYRKVLQERFSCFYKMFWNRTEKYIYTFTELELFLWRWLDCLFIKSNVGTYASSTRNSFVKHIKNVDQWQIKVHASVILVFMLVSYLTKNICKTGLTLMAQKYHVQSLHIFRMPWIPVRASQTFLPANQLIFQQLRHSYVHGFLMFILLLL